MAVKDVIRAALASKIGVKLEKDLFPVFASGSGLSFPAGARQVTVPQFDGPQVAIFEVSDADGEEHRIITRHAKVSGGVALLLDRPLSRGYTNAAVVIAGGHVPTVTPPGEIVLEVLEQNGARIVHAVSVDKFTEMFGDLFPAAMAFGAKPTIHAELKRRNHEPDATPGGGMSMMAAVSNEPADRGYSRFFDEWLAEGLIK